MKTSKTREREQRRRQFRESLGTSKVEPSTDNEPATNSYHLAHLRKLVRQAAKQGRRRFPIVLYARDSDRKQVRRGNLKDQLTSAIRRVRRLEARYGVKIVIHDEVAGQETSWKYWDRPIFKEAVELAEKHNATIVALSTCRFLRNKRHAKGVMPTEHDFEELLTLAKTVPLATIIHPDKPPRDVRSQETKRGLRKSKSMAPGYKKQRREEKIGRVARLKKRGWSINRIAAKVKVSRSTVWDWIQKVG